MKKENKLQLLLIMNKRKSRIFSFFRREVWKKSRLQYSIKLKLQKRKGNKTGPGSRKGKKTSRLPRKTAWILKIRVQRKFLSELKEKKLVTNSAYKDLLSKANDRLVSLYETKGELTGVSTGFADFDKMTSGLQAGDMVVIAGRPSMGKTSFAMNIAEFAAMKQEKPVLVFSLEMPAEQLALRMISSLGRIDQHKVRTGQLSDADWPRVTSAVSVLSESKLYVDDTPALSPLELRTRARRIARKHGGLSLIVIDYLQLMTSPASHENRTNEISEISRSLKAIAKEFHVPVIALSQLNRGLEQRTDKRPVMSDLRESGAIEQDADVIAFIYRDEVYNEDSPNKGTAEIIIRKQRNGPIGDFRLTFLGQYTRFENHANNRADFDDGGLR